VDLGRLLEQRIDVPVLWLLFVAARQEDDVGSNTRQMVSDDFCVSGVVGRFPLSVVRKPEKFQSAVRQS
jgi:hypothetical protein